LSRRLKQNFNCKPLDELASQLAFSPPDKRAQQVKRIERLHDQIDPGKNYPLDFLAYRITAYRREGKDAVVLAGEAVLPDLRLMIDALSRSVQIPMDDEADPVDPVKGLADRLGVSTKTISRWRNAGLRWRWVAPKDGGRKVVVIPRVASDRYIREHPEQVKRAAAFTQIDPQTRRKLIERARQIATRREVSLNQVASHLSSKTGRGLETIRQVLSNYDRDHPRRAIFTDHTGPLRHEQKRVIARAYRMGVPVDRIAERFKRTRSTIYRTIHQHGAGKAGRVSLAYVPSPTFDREDAEEVILNRPMEALTKHKKLTDAPADDLPEAVRPLFHQPVIPHDRMRALFIRYNFLKYRAVRTRDSFDRYNPGAGQVQAFNDWVEQARELRDLLVRFHLPVVLSVSRRHLIGEPSPGPSRLMALIEAGLDVLIQSVETFNPTRQKRFDSILTNRLMGRFASESSRPKGRALRRGDADDALGRLNLLADEAGVRIYAV
jgi:RNA polymerase primary sigma factor